MRSVVPVLAALVLASTSACSAFSEDEGAADDGGVRVVAAFYPLQYAADRVGGDLVSVDNLTVPGQEPHDLELTVKETAAIANADLVLFEEGFQPAVDAAVETNAEGAVLDAAEAVELLPSEEGEHEDEHAEEDDHAADEEHADEEHTDEEHTDEEHTDEHDHGDLDPHFWQDPVLLADLADAVADELAELDPDNADAFVANAADLRGELESLDGDYAAGLEGCERETVVVSHDAFGYLEKYDLHFEAIAGLSPDAEPTPADLGRLQQLIEEDGITTVFGERLAPPALVDTLANDAGVATAVLDPIEGLTDETEGEDYLSLMTQNLEALREANGCP